MADDAHAHDGSAHERVHDLLEQMLAGTLDSAGRAELDAMLCASPEVAALYVEQVDLHAMLQWEHGTAKPTSADAMSERMLLDDLFSQALEQRRLHELEHEAQQQLASDQESQRRLRELELRQHRMRLREAGVGTRSRKLSNTAIWIGIAAMVGLALWIGRATSSPPQPGQLPPQADRNVDTPVPAAFDAVLRNDVDARWASASARPMLNTPVGDQVYELVSGLARFEMGHGASIVVEGPARLRVIGPGRVHLETGRLTANVPVGSSDFVVSTPTAEVINEGTSFGVETRGDLGTYAHVFAGQVTVTPRHPGASRSALPMQVRSNHAALVDAGGAHVVATSADSDRFVQRGTFDALAGTRGRQDQADALYAMWERDAALIAAHPFTAEQLGLTYGWRGGLQVQAGDYRIEEDSLAWAERDTFSGGRLVLSSAFDASTVFLDLDVRRGGPADRAGLLTRSGGQIGRDGTRVCIAWTMCLEQGQTESVGWCGLSLFNGDMDQRTSEMIFFGKCSEVNGWGVQSHRDAPGGPHQNLILPERLPVVPGRVYQWLVVIDFQAGKDRVAVYLDPDVEDLGDPFVVLTQSEIEFDRLRLETEMNDNTWSFDDLHLGTDIQTVLSN